MSYQGISPRDAAAKQSETSWVWVGQSFQLLTVEGCKLLWRAIDVVVDYRADSWLPDGASGDREEGAQKGEAEMSHYRCLLPGVGQSGQSPTS